MKRMVSCMVFTMLLFVGFSAWAVDYPSLENRPLNDLAGILDAKSKEHIEGILRDFKKRTKNEFAVVIVPDLQGETVATYAVELFARMGLGQKDVDNGMLLLIGMRERKAKIEVGYGLEGALTDMMSGRILKKNLVPNFKEKKYAVGIEKTLLEAMNIVAPPTPKVLTPEERAKKAQEAKAAYAALLEEQKREEERKELFKQTAISIFGGALAIGLVVGLLAWIVSAFNKWRERVRMIREERVEISRRINFLNSFVKDCELRIRDFRHTKFSGVPSFVTSEMEDATSDLEKGIVGLRKDLENVEDPERLKKLDQIRECAGVIKRHMMTAAALTEKWQKLEILPESINRQCAEVSDNLSSLKEKIASVKETRLNMSKEGFRVGFEREISDFEKEIVSIEKALTSSSVDPRKFSNGIQELYEKAANVSVSLADLSSAKLEADQKIDSFPAILESLPGEHSKAEAILEKLNQWHAESVWKDVASEMGQFDEKRASILSLVESAKGKNTMQVQQFQDALSDARKAEGIVSSIRNVFLEIADKFAKAEAAKEGFGQALSQAQSSIQSAKNKADDNDVTSSTKSKVRGLDGKLEEVRRMASTGGLVDWLAIAAALAGIAVSATQLKKLAASEISAAEAARAAERKRIEDEAREKREAEERAEREREEARERASRRDDNYISGGGKSGGGGAEAEW